ncbi:bifunctional 2-polyprenyl-6-hydroxyphenol methylase/3-demethylubiquinol 3-O-methyltransferase UbiG [Jannaschia sp. M317]|uniref:class I SAM-dependent methyltransferase n=1 Tax=Jannaschia sp. M317 TaxID=2867011 RepID=UPI0021A9634C|nr:methyltransferase [Jannaschia sp. M317]UWQ17325.1 methyltransferase [Jannaschia sp. M317]
MVTITEHYDAYPYPARDPAEEDRRLITGSPSRPVEMDHYLWGGRRDWSQPLRVLVAGGGSGDGTVQLAQLLTDAGRPYDITYLDMAPRARAVAEARVARRGLSGVTFRTGSLLDAADMGVFDYIDCCGVLHHLPDPAAGFAALRAACAPGGGLGFMVYAPYGRSGVYPLQDAFGTLFEGLAPEARLARAKAIVARLPEGHPFRCNPHLVDHEASDAGFYDLLLHSQDRAFSVAALEQTLNATGWQVASYCQPGLYDPSEVAGPDHGLTGRAARSVAEQLRGTMKVHVAYAVPQGVQQQVARGTDRTLVPHLVGVPAGKLAQAVAAGRRVPVTAGGTRRDVALPKAAARLIAGIDGRRTLAEIARGAGADPLAFGALWSRVEAGLMPWGLLQYSGLLRR